MLSVSCQHRPAGQSSNPRCLCQEKSLAICSPLDQRHIRRRRAMWNLGHLLLFFVFGAKKSNFFSTLVGPGTLKQCWHVGFWEFLVEKWMFFSIESIETSEALTDLSSIIFWPTKSTETKSITVSPLIDTSSIAPFSAQKKVVLLDPCEDAVALASVAMATERCGLRGGEWMEWNE